MVRVAASTLAATTFAAATSKEFSGLGAGSGRSSQAVDSYRDFTLAKGLWLDMVSPPRSRARAAVCPKAFKAKPGDFKSKGCAAN